MQFQLTAAVISDNTLIGPFGCKDGDLVCEFLGDPGQPISEIVVRKKVRDYRALLPSIDTNGQLPHVRVPANPVSDELIAVLQHFESIGSFWCGIERIAWHDCESTWVPETAAEGEELSLLSFGALRRVYPPLRDTVLPGLVEEIIRFRGSFKRLVLPFSFYREGMNEYRQHRYINAFYNFYFFLEDLYGEGHTKNRKVLQSFLGSEELATAVRTALEKFAQPEMAEQNAGLAFHLENENCDRTVEGALRLLVNVRGTLHHFSQHSSKFKGHPLNHEAFRSVAFLTMATAIACATVVITRRHQSARDARGAGL